MRRLIRIAILIVGTLTAQAAVAEQLSPAKQRWMLWNDCKGLQLRITVAPDAVNFVEQIGISKERIESHLRDKLRAERIYVTETLPSGSMMLYIMLKGIVKTKTVANHEYKSVVVGVLGGFGKKFPGSEYFAVTYADFILGYARNPDPESIEARAVRYGRVLIDDYLRVNADACKNSN